MCAHTDMHTHTHTHTHSLTWKHHLSRTCWTRFRSTSTTNSPSLMRDKPCSTGIHTWMKAIYYLMQCLRFCCCVNSAWPKPATVCMLLQLSFFEGRGTLAFVTVLCIKSRALYSTTHWSPTPVWGRHVAGACRTGVDGSMYTWQHELGKNPCTRKFNPSTNSALTVEVSKVMVSCTTQWVYREIYNLTMHFPITAYVTHLACHCRR